MTRRLSVLAAVAIALTSGGCGVRTDAAPRVLSAADIPYGLLDSAPAPTAPPTTTAAAAAPVNVYFVRGGRMTAVLRQVNAPASVAKALTALVFGPTEEEASGGVRSAINPTAAVQARAVDPTTFLVDLSPEFAQGAVSEQVLGLAQIVYTATDIPGVIGVRFTLNGAPVQVPTPLGATAEPVGREAFAELAPVPPGIEPPGGHGLGPGPDG